MFTALRASQRGEQASCILGGAQQVGGLDKPGEFAGGNEGNIAGSPASNDHGFLLIHNLIKNARQVLRCVVGLLRNFGYKGMAICRRSMVECCLSLPYPVYPVT